MGDIGNMGRMGKPQQSTPPTPESSLTPFEQAVQLKKMDMETEMKKMENEMKKMENEMKMKKMEIENYMNMKKMDNDVEMKKKDKDTEMEMKKMENEMKKQIIGVLGFVTGVVIFSISLKDGLLGNRVNSFLAWLQAGLMNNKLFLKAWIGASIADKVSLLFNRIWNFVFLKKSLPVTKLF